MKVLFLDIDGVLNSTRSAVALGGYPYCTHTATYNRFDKIAVKLIKRLCSEHDVKIVLSSTWRRYSEWTTLVTKIGLNIIDITPILTFSERRGLRGAEIDQWLINHPEVTKYAIVDDDNDMLEQQLPHFVHTENMNGLMYGDYLKLVNLLKD